MHKRRAYVVGMSIIVVIIAVVLAYTFIWRQQPGQSHSNIPTPPPNNTPIAPVKTALSCTEKLPLSIQIGQKIMGAGYSDLLVSTKSAFVSNAIGGVILMNETSAQDIQSFAQGFAITPTIAVDQEGGTVQRYKSEGAVAGAAEMAADYTTDQAYQAYLRDATYLKSVGITVNFAPVLGVISTAPSPLPDRMYSSDPAVVTQYASTLIKASQQVGITPVVKHFPGLGSASGNTDLGSATTDPLSILKTRDLLPFQQLANLKSDAMVSNAIVPGLTNGQPAIWSPDAITLLRGYGYQDAVVYTDSLTAQAIPGTIEDAAVKAWQAGIDIALVVQTHENTATLVSLFEAMQVRAAAAVKSGELKAADISKSVLRILQRKHIDPCSLAM